jgi:DNA-directed RNA polymerase specialized sigma24 family protein
MLQNFYTSESAQSHQEQEWSELYTWLLALVKRWVYYADVPTWRKQHREISEDIVQEAIVRTYLYHQQATSDKSRPITSLKAFSTTTARNYFQDRRRKEQRLALMTQNDIGMTNIRSECYATDPAQIAVDQLILTETIDAAARNIASFPARQKQALLRDLANIADFTERPTLLEQALAKEGIQLHDYHHLPLRNPIERQRHSSLLTIAYKRLKKEQ